MVFRVFPLAGKTVESYRWQLILLTVLSKVKKCQRNKFQQERNSKNLSGKNQLFTIKNAKERYPFYKHYLSAIQSLASSI